MWRSFRGAFLKGRFHNKSNSEPIRRGAFLQAPFLQGVGGGGVSLEIAERKNDLIKLIQGHSSLEFTGQTLRKKSEYGKLELNDQHRESLLETTRHCGS